ncbi:MAG TPA: hypothetical protein VJ963_06530 [Bacteroidales bacterium]|nr:hypothetical protein [Bacteroidales bacterium]
MIQLNEHNIEQFIRDNRDKFGVYRPPRSHRRKFYYKLETRIKHYYCIVPYLFKVAVVTVLIFAGSVIIWNNYIRKDRHEITLKNKISLVISKLNRH